MIGDRERAWHAEQHQWPSSPGGREQERMRFNAGYTAGQRDALKSSAAYMAGMTAVVLALAILLALVA